MLPDLKLHRSGFPSRYPLEEDHIWVWSVDEELENEVIYVMYVGQYHLGPNDPNG